jgi:phosphoglycolate phosphatase-like HAD superfamily hydrolase
VKLLALDFDGVICDSAPETFWTGLRTYLALQPESRFRESAEHPGPAPAAIFEHPLYRAFVELMPLGNRAEDFGVVLAALDAGAALPDQAAYDQFRSGIAPDWLAKFHERFYAERHALLASDPEGWHALMSPYAEFVALLCRRAGDVLFAIATAKDRESVRALLARYRVLDLFREDLVLDKQTGVSKRAHLERLAELSGISGSEITFVDDKVSHLDSAAALGVRCALATWGYNSAREEALARERGYLVCTLASFEAQIFSPDPARKALATAGAAEVSG